MIQLNVNGETYEIEVADDTPLLWVIRENLGLNGTKFGCGVALCGACTVHLDGKPVRSCVIPASFADGKAVTTIEGVAGDDGLHPVQQAWIDEQVPQCGYCQSGQIMSAVALLQDNPNPDDAAIDSAMSGNICRCGMYSRIRRGIKRADFVVVAGHPQPAVLIETGFLTNAGDARRLNTSAYRSKLVGVIARGIADYFAR